MGTLIAQNKLLVIAGGIAIAVGLWYGLSPSSSSDALLVADQTGGPGQEVVDTLRQLDAVKLDGTLFSNPTFSSLRDFSTQIIPEPVGRPNPFAPLSATTTPSASPSHADKVFAPGH